MIKIIATLGGEGEQKDNKISWIHFPKISILLFTTVDAVRG